jgi:hypothetical protein
MNKNYSRTSILVLILILVSCTPSASQIQSQIQTAVEQTQAALPTVALTDTPEPTSTITPTKLPTDTALPTADNTLEAIIHTDLAGMIEKLGDVETVTTVRPGSESLEIELRIQWASKDRQPDVSYETILMLAIVFGSASEEQDLPFVAGNPQHFSILLTTYSVDGDYKYSSLTYYDTLVKLYNKQITYDEWVNEAKADFVK